MLARSLLIPPLLLAVACSSSTVGVESNNEDTSGSLALAAGSGAQTTEDFEVVVEQPDAPPVMRGFTSVDVRYVITIVNRTKESVTIQRITIQSLGGGDYQVPLRSRPFNRAIAPATREKFEFWATATVTDPTIGTRAPLMLRTTITAQTVGGERREWFIRRVNSRVAVRISG